MLLFTLTVMKEEVLSVAKFSDEMKDVVVGFRKEYDDQLADIVVKYKKYFKEKLVRAIKECENVCRFRLYSLPIKDIDFTLKELKTEQLWFTDNSSVDAAFIPLQDFDIAVIETVQGTFVTEKIVKFCQLLEEEGFRVYLKAYSGDFAIYPLIEVPSEKK